ncbi:hypothetical protein OEZ85_003198 [Tetradesmus obliquus]|uniref:Sushi domain-containing protein n=1 Tax=Tetradesmus obliquus TaxID=3088 RepID=A0ABY8U0H4_TETOB|nr:hypothetical protein OEZ85_003198 [Tetradesmus obliquus]
MVCQSGICVVPCTPTCTNNSQVEPQGPCGATVNDSCGGVCELKCSSTSQCTFGTQADAQLGVCVPIPKDCVGSPANPPNGAWVCGQTTADSQVCQGTCNSTFVMSGTLSVPCANGVWGATQGVCVLPAPASFTQWNSSGGDSYPHIFLERHNVGELCSAFQAMQSFQLEMRYDNNPPLMRLRYQCDESGGNSGAAAARYITPTNDWGGGNTIYFDRHNISCPANQVLQRWRLVRPSETTIAFEYFCAPASLNAATCVQRATLLDENGNGQLRYLDRHSPACPLGKVMTRWRLENAWWG